MKLQKLDPKFDENVQTLIKERPIFTFFGLRKVKLSDEGWLALCWLLNEAQSQLEVLENYAEGFQKFLDSLDSSEDTDADVMYKITMSHSVLYQLSHVMFYLSNAIDRIPVIPNPPMVLEDLKWSELDRLILETNAIFRMSLPDELRVV